jgi:hypothetical protein
MSSWNRKSSRSAGEFFEAFQKRFNKPADYWGGGVSWASLQIRHSRLLPSDSIASPSATTLRVEHLRPLIGSVRFGNSPHEPSLGLARKMVDELLSIVRRICDEGVFARSCRKSG